MTDWMLVLILLSVAAVLSCFRFIGCVLDSEGAPGGGTPPPAPVPEYGDTIKAEAIAYWRLGEGTGTVPGDTAKDEKGLQDGTYQSTALMAAVQSPPTPDPPILQTGQPGLLTTSPSHTSVKVDGGHVSVGYHPALNPPADKAFSVEAWVIPEWRTGELDLFRCVVASREDTGANKHGYILYAGPVLDPTTFATTDPAMHWQAWVGDGTTWLMLVGPPVEVGQTTYLLLTFDGQDPDKPLTLDAITANTDMSTYARWVRSNTDYSPNPEAAARPLYIGMGAPEIPPTGTPLYPFLGRLQEIAFYDKALTKTQASDHVTAGQGE
jgi:hypothetical protein